MVDYTLLALMILFCAGLPYSLTPRYQKIGYWFCLFILIILSAFRGPTIGNDTPSYIHLFNTLSPEEHSRYEIGFAWLNESIKYFTNDYQVLFWVISLFTYYSFGRFMAKYSKMPWLSLYLFFTYGFFTFTFTALRQGIAMAICLYAFEAMMKNRNIKSVILIICASFFHSTAIIFFLSFLCKLFNPSKKLFVFGYISAFILLAVFTIVLNYVFQMLPMYEHYAEGTYIGETGIAGFLYAFLSSNILLFSYSKLSHTNVKHAIIEKVNSYGLIMVLLAVILYIVSIKANIFDRMAIYFNVLSLIVFPNAIIKLSGVKLQLVIIAVMIIFYAYSAFIIIYRPEWISIYPYSFYWQK